MEKLEVRSLSFAYPGSKSTLEDISFSLSPGDFMLLCGSSGCGKSTLLRCLKPTIAPRGKRSGEILYDGRPTDSLDPRESASELGFVGQSPEAQLVTDKVWHELAFGLESLGIDSEEIRRRTAETASFFGMKDRYHQSTVELSGGQKQQLVLASIMAMRPGLLILDEPTAQLDPIAASELIACLGRINRELGTTIILTEHRPEDSFAYANKLAVMENGRLIAFDKPELVGKELLRQGSRTFSAMPAAMRVWAGVGFGECPTTVNSGRSWLADFSSTHPLKPIDRKVGAKQASDKALDNEKSSDNESVANARKNDILLKADELWFTYERGSPYIVKGFSTELRRGELHALLGSNGAGKTTVLRLLAGLEKPIRGELERNGRLGFLPQDPKLLLLESSVRAELKSVISKNSKGRSDSSGSDEARLEEMIDLCRLGELLDRHPYELSGGEQQRVALAKVLLTRPDILLLDEPTKGLDAAFRTTLADILGELKKDAAILIVSHDVEFCASYADKCGLLFDGAIVSSGTPHEFFGSMTYYATPARRIARGFSDAVTVDELIIACGGEAQRSLEPEISALPPNSVSEPKLSIPKWRRAAALIPSAAAIIAFVLALKQTDFSRPDRLDTSGLIYSAVFVVSLALIAMLLGTKGGAVSVEPKKRSKRSMLLSAALILLMLPTIALGSVINVERSYYITAILLMLECIAAFFVSFEGRKPSAREVTVIAVLCALGVAGRAAFFMLPQFKPVLALTIIVGAAFGGESGFLVGAMTMLTSNLLFSQGPWTPWQMLAMGLCGFFAGILFSRRRPTRLGLCIFGALEAVIVYGGIMNLSSALTAQTAPTQQTILAYYLTGFPMDLVHAAATALFIYLAAPSMLEKLERVKKKL